MPVGYAIGSDVFDRIKPKIRQWEINKQRRIDPNVLQSMLEAEMSTATKEADTRFFRATELEQRQQALDAAEQTRKDAASAATVQGAVNIGTLGATGYLGYKGMQNQKTMADAYKTIADKVSTGTAGGGQVAVEPGVLQPPGALKTPAGYKYAGGGQPADAAVAPPESFGGPTIDMAPVAGDSTTFAPVAPSADVGGLAVDASSLPAVAEGGQAAIAGETAAVAGTGAQTTVAAGEAALTAEESAALAADVGVGGEMGAEGLMASESGLGLGSVALPVAAYAAGDLVAKGIEKWSPIGGAKEKSIAGHVVKGAATGAAVGSIVPVIGTAVGAVVGGIIGAAVGFAEDVSVVCSELLRQGRITENDRKKCVVYRFRHISDDMFDAYLEWAGPHVKAMQRGGWRNWVRLPFAHAFVRYMIKMHHVTRLNWTKPTRFERLVWAHAWRRCEEIARKRALNELKGVA